MLKHTYGKVPNKDEGWTMHEDLKVTVLSLGF